MARQRQRRRRARGETPRAAAEPAAPDEAEQAEAEALEGAEEQQQQEDGEDGEEALPLQTVEVREDPEARRRRRRARGRKPAAAGLAAEGGGGGGGGGGGQGLSVLEEYALSSDEEGENLREDVNTMGRGVPLHWYDEFDHIGYDREGRKIPKGTGEGGEEDALDRALAQQDDPELYARTVYDAYNGRVVHLTDREMDIVRRLASGNVADKAYNMYPDTMEHYIGKTEGQPLNADPEPKSRFLPSKWEWMKVMKIVKGMREGRIHLDRDGRPLDRPRRAGAKDEVFLLWGDDDESTELSKRMRFHLPAPKVAPPGHAESYNPPPEYLFTEEELKEWEEMDPEERPLDFIPQRIEALRKVGAFPDTVKERFERCLDLYLCPRTFKKRLNIDPESLVPRLPRPRELRPFPDTLIMQFLGHTGRVRSISVSPDGQYLASGGQDGTLRLWEVDTSLCVRSWNLGAPVIAVKWNPVASHCIIAAAVGKYIVLVASGTGDRDATELTEALLAEAEDSALRMNMVPTPAGAAAANAAAALKMGNAADDDEEKDEDEDEDEGEDSDEGEEDRGDESEREESAGAKAAERAFPSRRNPVLWRAYSLAERIAQSSSELPGLDPGQARSKSVQWFGSQVGPRIAMEHEDPVTAFDWHYKGDYMVSTVPNAPVGRHVLVHQLSQRASRCPFSRKRGDVQAVNFHPSKPFLFVATKQHIFVYHLVDQKLAKRLLTGCKWLSSMHVHPSGDHVVAGSYDRRLVWFDLDMANTPYKTLRYHNMAVRTVAFHPTHPLFASASDDGQIHVFHAMVYSDLLRNPLVVPLKILRGHDVVAGVGVLSLAFHPTQPWVFSAGADGAVHLYTDCS